MAHIDRPGKAGGTSRYTTEVAAGYDLIRETEVDGDLDTIYAEFNGGIDDTNIRAGASIDYSKLDLTHRIIPDDLVPGFAFPSGGSISGGSIVPGSIPPGAYAPGSIDTPDLHEGAASQWFAQNGATVTLPYVVLDTAEHAVSSLIWTPASRNGIVWMFGMFSGGFGAPGPETHLWGRIRRDTPSGTQLAISTVQAQFSGSTAFAPFQVSCMSLPRLGAGFAGPLYLTLQLSNAGGAYAGTTISVQDVQFIAVELA